MMRTETHSLLANFTMAEAVRSALISGGFFAGLGTLTALWGNPFFARMTPVAPFDYILLGAESVLLGLILGMRNPVCEIKRLTFGGIFAFLGFGCSLCNKILLLAFGASSLLTWFEPARPLIGIAVIVVLSAVLWRRLQSRQVSLPPPSPTV